MNLYMVAIPFINPSETFQLLHYAFIWGLFLIKKPCNVQKCPGTIEMEEKKTLPMSVKTIKFSSKPWRYERCILIEQDVDIIMEDLKQFKNKPRIPHRIVMNNQTFSIFENFDHNTVQFTFKNKYVEVENSEYPDCILLSDKRSKVTKKLCTV